MLRYFTHLYDDQSMNISADWDLQIELDTSQGILYFILYSHTPYIVGLFFRTEKILHLDLATFQRI